MKGNAHCVAGIISGVALSAAFFASDFTTPFVVTGFSAIGSLMADIDLPSSTVGKILKPVSKLINKGFGHRTITHSALWLIPLVLFYCYSKEPFVIGYTIGFFSHLLTDTFTSGGTPVIYPFSRKRLSLSKIKSGKHDGLITAFSLFLIIGCIVATKLAQTDVINVGNLLLFIKS